MARSKFVYSMYTQNFKKFLRRGTTKENLEEATTIYEVYSVPKESELRRILPCYVELLDAREKFMDEVKEYKVNLNDDVTVKTYLTTEKDSVRLLHVVDLIDIIFKNFELIKKICIAGDNRKSVTFGFILYLSEKTVKNVCDKTFGEGNDSSLVLLQDLKFDLKRRRIYILGAPEYLEGTSDSDVMQKIAQDTSKNYREGGWEILK